MQESKDIQHIVILKIINISCGLMQESKDIQLNEDTIEIIQVVV